MDTKGKTKMEKSLVVIDPERLAEMDAAKQMVKLPNISLQDLSRVTGIPYQTIRNMRHKPELLDNASWFRVETLAQLKIDLETGKLDLETGKRAIVKDGIIK